MGFDPATETVNTTSSDSHVEYLEYDSDVFMTEAEFEAVTDFIAELLLQNHLRESKK